MEPLDRARERVARSLEAGAWDGAVARALAGAWGAVASRTVARPLALPDGARVVAIGGATLGGSGKTPLAIACAQAIAAGAAGEGRERVAFIAHGYRARVREPHIVHEDDDVILVGDEALLAARALGAAASVVVAPTRQAAIDHAASLANTLVLDGVLQTTPRAASVSLLALDAWSPWGAGHPPPRGDLRASRRDLLAACDRVVLLHDDLSPHLSLPYGRSGGEGHEPCIVRVVSRGAHLARRLLLWSELASMRIGLFTALARPARLVTSLALRGVTPAVTVSLADHARISPPGLARRLASAPVDLWLASPKCAPLLASAGILHGTLDHEVIPDESLRSALATAPPLAPDPRALP